MANAPIHPVPIEGGKKSVLSGKDPIRGLAKSEMKGAQSRSDFSCESVLSGQQCVGGVKPMGRKK